MNTYTKRKITASIVSLGVAGSAAYAINDRYNEPGRGERIEACPIGYEPNVVVYDTAKTRNYLLTLEESKRVADDFAESDGTPPIKLPDYVQHAGELICSEYDGFSGITTPFLAPAGERILALAGVSRVDTKELPDGMKWFTRPEEWRSPLDPILLEPNL